MFMIIEQSVAIEANLSQITIFVRIKLQLTEDTGLSCQLLIINSTTQSNTYSIEILIIFGKCAQFRVYRDKDLKKKKKEKNKCMYACMNVCMFVCI